MAASGPSVRLKRLRQRFGISAPKLAIRTHVAWYWRALSFVVILSLSIAIGAWVYDAGRRIAGFHSDESVKEIQSLRNHMMELDGELTKLRTVAGSGESSLQIERATLRQLSLQVKALESENTALKEDLAFFEGLMPTSDAGDDSALRIDYLRLVPGDLAGEYRYRMLAVNNASRQGKEFRGALQLLVKVQVAGKDAMITVPSDADKNPQRFRFEIKHYHRLEGVFTVPEGAAVKNVEARLLQDGVVRAKRLLTL